MKQDYFTKCLVNQIFSLIFSQKLNKICNKLNQEKNDSKRNYVRLAQSF